jgi:hypothetical protein
MIISMKTQKRPSNHYILLEFHSNDSLESLVLLELIEFTKVTTFNMKNSIITMAKIMSLNFLDLNATLLCMFYGFE